MLMADPKLAGFDCVELGQYLYEDGAEFHERHPRKSVRSNNARRLESELMELLTLTKHFLLSISLTA